MARRWIEIEESVKELTYRVNGAAFAVHTALGPGLSERIYQEAMTRELRREGIAFAGEVPVRLTYRGEPLDASYRLDLVIEGQIVVEIKSVAAILPVHLAQLLNYLRLWNAPVGLLYNFNVVHLRDEGLRRVVNSFYSPSS